MDKLLLRVDEAAERLNVSRWTVYRWIEEGHLVATKIGKGSLRVMQESALRLIDANRTDQRESCEASRRGCARRV